MPHPACVRLPRAASSDARHSSRLPARSQETWPWCWTRSAPTRRGWAMTNHLRTELVLDALNMALWRRRPEGVIHHSDQGCQYTSIAFGSRCREAGVRPSMGSVGDCFDKQCASRSSPRSSANCSTEPGSGRRPRRVRRSSISSRAGTIRIAVTRDLTTSRRSTKKEAQSRFSGDDAQKRLRRMPYKLRSRAGMSVGSFPFAPKTRPPAARKNCRCPPFMKAG